MKIHMDNPKLIPRKMSWAWAYNWGSLSCRWARETPPQSGPWQRDTTTVRTLAERPVLLRERLVPPLLLLCQWKRNVPKINPDISHQQGVRCQRPQRDTSHRGRSLYLLMDGFIYGWISLLTYLLFFNLLTFLFFSYFLFCLFPLICVPRSCCSGNHTESSISECFISSCLSPPDSHALYIQWCCRCSCVSRSRPSNTFTHTGAKRFTRMSTGTSR